MQQGWAVEGAASQRVAHTARVLGLLAVLLGCGGNASDGERAVGDGQAKSPVRPVTIEVRPPPPSEISYVTQDPCRDDSPGEGCAAPPAEESGPNYLVSEQFTAESVLLVFCGTCHGPQRDEGGIGPINDWDALTEGGFIVPCDSDGSPIIQLMRSGAMPPSGTMDRPGRRDIDAVALVIDKDCLLR